MRLCYLLGFLILNASLSKAQTNLKLNGDLKGAQQLEVNRKYSFLKSPVGFGLVKEFKSNPQTPAYIFKEERNTAWFTLNIPFKGALTFEIIPHRTADDYDWMLFNFNGLQKEIEKGTAKPLRTNNTRNEKSTAGKTGLKPAVSQTFTQPGKGNNYSKTLDVKTGEKLALIVDNIYHNGAGFDIKINLSDPPLTGSLVVLEGIVRDKNTKKPLPAEVIAEDDSTGTFIAKTISNPLTGKYKLNVPANQGLNLTAYNSNYLFITKDITLKNSQHNTLDFELDTLQSGSKLILVNIHFYPNKDLILPTSKPELERLLGFLKEHPSWSAKIIGHSNNNIFASARYLQQLSFNRAIAIKKFLTQNAIPEARVSCAGMGGKNPIANTNNPVDELQNLRVEVVLTNEE